MYRDIPMSERLDKIGELLAKGVYLYLKKEKEASKAKEEATQPIVELISTEIDKNK